MTDEEDLSLAESVRALFEHLTELLNANPELDNEIISLSTDVLAQINVGIMAAKHPKTLDQFEGAKSTHNEFVTGHREFIELTDRLRGFFNLDRLESELLAFRKLINETNHENLADEDLLKDLKYSTDLILEVPNRLAFFVATSRIAMFKASIFFRDTLAAYLGRPTAFDSLWEESRTLVEAAAKDVVGIFYPVVSTLEAMARISTPRILQEFEKLEEVVDTVDRVHLLHDHLSELCLLERKAKSDVEIAIAEATSLSAKFKTETEWVNSVLAAAKNE